MLKFLSYSITIDVWTWTNQSINVDKIFRQKLNAPKWAKIHWWIIFNLGISWHKGHPYIFCLMFNLYLTFLALLSVCLSPFYILHMSSGQTIFGKEPLGTSSRKIFMPHFLRALLLSCNLFYFHFLDRETTTSLSKPDPVLVLVVSTILFSVKNDRISIVELVNKQWAFYFLRVLS